MPQRSRINFQEFVFPALKVKGFVKADYSRKKKFNGFDFARYFHVASAEGYAKSDIYADYLTARL